MMRFSFTALYSAHIFEMLMWILSWWCQPTEQQAEIDAQEVPLKCEERNSVLCE